MKKFLMVIPSVFLLCFTFSCQKEISEEPVLDVEADVEALKDILDEWLVAYNAGELEKLASFFYAENAVSMDANQPILEGREAILANYKKNREQNDEYCESSIYEDVRVFGDLAFVRGNDTGIYTPKDGGEPTKYDEKWVCIFERQPDGTWKCIIGIGNSNLPLPTLSEQK
jgi:ketosteroid isomerase-like protein